MGSCNSASPRASSLAAAAFPMSGVVSLLSPLALLRVLLPLLALAGCIGWVVYTRRFHPLANVPGPFLASITRAWLVVQAAGGSAETKQRRLHEKYGKSREETDEALQKLMASGPRRPYSAR
jgi:hypothetical protein